MSGKRWIAYAVGIAALAAVFVFLRAGDKKPSAKTTNETPSSVPEATGSSQADRPALPSRPASAAKTPTTRSANLGDGSDIEVPENTFGENLPPPPLPSKNDKPSRPEKKKPYTHEEKQAQRRKAIALMERHMKKLEAKAKEAASAGNEQMAAKIRIRLARMKQHRDRTAAEIERTDREGEPDPNTKGLPPKGGHHGHDH